MKKVSRILNIAMVFMLISGLPTFAETIGNNGDGRGIMGKDGKVRNDITGYSINLLDNYIGIYYPKAIKVGQPIIIIYDASDSTKGGVKIESKKAFIKPITLGFTCRQGLNQIENPNYDKAIVSNSKWKIKDDRQLVYEESMSLSAKPVSVNEDGFENNVVANNVTEIAIAESYPKDKNYKAPASINYREMVCFEAAYVIIPTQEGSLQFTAYLNREEDGKSKAVNFNLSIGAGKQEPEKKITIQGDSDLTFNRSIIDINLDNLNYDYSTLKTKVKTSGDINIKSGEYPFELSSSALSDEEYRNIKNMFENGLDYICKDSNDPDPPAIKKENIKIWKRAFDIDLKQFSWTVNIASPELEEFKNDFDISFSFPLCPYRKWSYNPSNARDFAQLSYVDGNWILLNELFVNILEDAVDQMYTQDVALASVGNIHGIALTSDGKALANRTVKIVGTDIQTTTSDKGEYALNNVPLGECEVSLLDVSGNEVGRFKVKVDDGSALSGVSATVALSEASLSRKVDFILLDTGKPVSFLTIPIPPILLFVIGLLLLPFFYKNRLMVEVEAVDGGYRVFRKGGIMNEVEIEVNRDGEIEKYILTTKKEGSEVIVLKEYHFVSVNVLEHTNYGKRKELNTARF